MKRSMIESGWDVGELPFVFGHLARPTNGDGIPDRMPFSLCMDEETGLLRQCPNDDVASALSIAYSKGSMITGNMDDEGIGKQYADAFLAFMQKEIGLSEFDGLKVLEIGCGTGYLLSRLRSLGAECTGIEPGEHGQHGAKKYGVTIYNDFFPTEKIKDHFDIIIFCSVLEHIEEPITFLAQVKSLLKPGGTILLGVPDCGPYVAAGDISIFLHEHWSYFERPTLFNLLVSAGAANIRIVKSDFGWLLYAAAGMDDETSDGRSWDVSFAEESALAFRQKAEDMIARLSGFLHQARMDRKTLGIYVPGRAVNFLALSNFPLGHCRFFDDNPLIHGTYFPGIDIPIESRQNLIENPTDIVLIMSHSFGKKIADELGQSLPSTTIVKTWNELFNPNG